MNVKIEGIIKDKELELTVTRFFTKERIILLKDYFNELLSIFNSIKGYKYKYKFGFALYYIVKNNCIPISVNLIFKYFDIKMEIVNNIIRKYNFKIKYYSSEEKIEKYCKYLRKLKEFNENEIIEICKKLIKEKDVANELALVCAVLFKKKIFKEKELAEITGLTDVSIRNYRRMINNSI